MSPSIQIESAVIHGWIEAYYDDNITVTVCTHDGSAASAVLQDDNVIGKQKVKARRMMLVCQSVCVLYVYIGDTGMLVGQYVHSLCHKVLLLYNILHGSRSNS